MFRAPRLQDDGEDAPMEPDEEEDDEEDGGRQRHADRQRSCVS